MRSDGPFLLAALAVFSAITLTGVWTWYEVTSPERQTSFDVRVTTPTASPTPTSTATPTHEPPAATPPRMGVAGLLPVPAEPVHGGTMLAVPDGTTVVWGGCASDGTCYPYNYFWWPTREVVMQLGEPAIRVQHELCHAHQAWSIGRDLAPAEYDLHPWYSTQEGASFSRAVAGLPWPWTHSAVNTLEDFAWTCAYAIMEPAELLRRSPEHYEWWCQRFGCQ